MRTCVAEEGCDKTKIVARGLCDCHYRMWRMYGRTFRYARRHGEGGLRSDGYIQVHENGKLKMQHIVVAEKALGKPLPPKAIVHHINEDRADNVPSNLVICPDQEYHMLIHKLMIAKGISFRKDGKPSKPLGRGKREEALKKDD